MNITSEYVRGFADGEGCFTLGIAEKPRKTKRIQVYAVFSITQAGDKGRELLEDIAKFLKCGKVYPQKQRNERQQPSYKLFIYGIDDLTTKIIPFFDAHPPITKIEIYAIWKEAIAIIKSNSVESGLPYHALTEESMQDLFRLKLMLEELMPNSRSPLHRRGRWRKRITPSSSFPT